MLVTKINRRVDGRGEEAIPPTCRTDCLSNHSPRPKENCTLLRSAGPIAIRKAVPETSNSEGARRIGGLRNDRECWWTAKVQKMKKALAVGNGRALLQLIRSAGRKKMNIAETTVIHSQHRHLKCIEDLPSFVIENCAYLARKYGLSAMRETEGSCENSNPTDLIVQSLCLAEYCVFGVVRVSSAGRRQDRGHPELVLWNFVDELPKCETSVEV
ncbi:hypothetical protein CLF_110290 [Clonorchis sinensis]|uniref:Uncharacterized protein n=1 Tax=Clonorchis sinensis TaxID=79923 RepID=G7YTC9_CLOSI|nr:hypothetical protein CLF_110290 [Clonorchis sinensis]